MVRSNRPVGRPKLKVGQRGRYQYRLFGVLPKQPKKGKSNGKALK